MLLVMSRLVRRALILGTTNLPDDGIITMKSIEVKVGANSQVTLSSLYLGDEDAADAVPADPTTNGADAPAATTALRLPTPPPRRLARLPVRAPRWSLPVSFWRLSLLVRFP